MRTNVKELMKLLGITYEDLLKDIEKQTEKIFLNKDEKQKEQEKDREDREIEEK